MAEPMDDKDNQSVAQGSTLRGLVFILAIALFLHVVWLAWLAVLAMVQTVMQVYIINEVSKCKKKSLKIYTIIQKLE